MSIAAGDGGVNLQATLLAASAVGLPEGRMPHHPITCTGNLRYHDDGAFACEHAAVSPGDVRTQFCVDHSIALLLMELSLDL